MEDAPGSARRNDETQHHQVEATERQPCVEQVPPKKTVDQEKFDRMERVRELMAESGGEYRR